MGRVTAALKKVTDDRLEMIQKKPEVQYIVKKVKNTSIEDHIVAFHDPMSPISEQYNTLRTNLHQLKKTKKYKTFMVTSSIDGEGKTVTSVNLAMTIARDLNERSVLLIDADMRKGRSAKYIGLPSSPGLSDFLSGDVSVNDIIMNPGIDNFTVITSGKPKRNPSELLNSKKMKDLVSTLRKKYDYILIDTPPGISISDACILGPMADAAILVVQAGRTQRDMIKNAEKKLLQSGIKIAGFVMTKIEYHLPGYLSKYMQKYDGYYAYRKYSNDNIKQKEMVS